MDYQWIIEDAYGVPPPHPFFEGAGRPNPRSPARRSSRQAEFQDAFTAAIGTDLLGLSGQAGAVASSSKVGG